MMIAVEPGYLRDRAARCRFLAREVMDERTSRILLELADEYEDRAAELVAAAEDEPPAPRKA